jgi:hypothetical protein
MIGILGAYVGRIYEEVQRRPLYTVAKEVNFSPDQNAGTAGPASATSKGSGGQTT